MDTLVVIFTNTRKVSTTAQHVHILRRDEDNRWSARDWLIREASMATRTVSNGSLKSDRKKKCKHEPDFETAGMSDYLEDELCEVGVACRKCGESGFVVFRPDGIAWNGDD
jgi:hypothetical protein